MDAKVLATLILIISYIILFSETVNRAVVAMLGAGIMVVTGILSQHSALAGVDFNTIFLLIGMMLIVGIAEKSGMFEFVAIWGAKKVKASPVGLLIVLTVITAIFSALLDNVTTVLLMVPITFQITKQLKIPAYPYLLIEIFASNIGGTATLIGDPPNIIIGSALNLSFMDFVRELTPVVIITLITITSLFYIVWHKKLITSDENKKAILAIKEKSLIKDFGLMYKSLFILIGVIVSFIAAEHIHIENGTIALLGAAILLLLYTFDMNTHDREQRISEAFNLVDWTTVFFFAGLFIIVHGMEETGVLKILGQKFAHITDGNIRKMTMLIIWFSAFLSSIIDNIPFVATMIPMLKSMEESVGGREVMMPVWWALSLGSCFGGNGSLIAASANVIVAGIAAKEKQPISFVKFLIWSIPTMLISITIASIYLYIKHF